MSNWIDEDVILGLIVVALIVIVIAAFVNISKKQEQEKIAFMAECLQENKQYQCDVLWSQTDASKQVRDAAIGFAAGAAIGAAAGRR